MRRTIITTTVVSLLWLAVGAASASAETTPSPWWGLSMSERPTDLRPLHKNDVQKVTVAATGGEFLLAKNIGEVFEGRFVILKWDATASEVQAGLEGLYGNGNVRVSKGQGNALGSEPYEIEFTGASGGRTVERIFAFNEPTVVGGKENLVGTIVDEVLTQGSSDGQLVVEAEDVGNAQAQGCSAVPAGAGKYSDAGCSEPVGPGEAGGFEKTPVTITDRLPEGLTAVAAEGLEGPEYGESLGEVKCAVAPSGREVTCTYEATVYDFEQIEILISVVVNSGARSGEVNTATVSGGGAAGIRTATHGIEVNGSERFGTENYTIVPENAGGSIDTQAGSHPFQITSVLTANSTSNFVAEGDPLPLPQTVALAKDYVAELPVGLVGNPTPFEQCTDAQFGNSSDLPVGAHGGGFFNECPASSAIGVALVRYAGHSDVSDRAAVEPIFNMTPGPGEPARFGFKVNGLFPVFLNASVRTGSDYGVTLASHNIIQLDWLQSVKLTFFGVPGGRAHEHQRGWECLDAFGSCTKSTGLTPPPFLIMPTSCEAPFTSTLHADSWSYEEHPSEVAEPFTYTLPKKIDGCNHLPFEPSITAAPDVPDASSATGLTTDVHVPQTAELNPEGLAESSVKDIEVALPPGVAVNPSGGNGLEACSEQLVGFQGEGESPTDAGVKTLLFTPSKPGSFGSEGSEKTLQPGVNFCADASKIGTVSIRTPLLPHELTGAVYLASQNANPFGSLLAMYIVAEDPVSGTLVKLPGSVSLNPATGQLTATFLNSPELPFEDAELHFFGGEKAPLATPSRCGSYTTNASFTPWSGTPATPSSSTFEIEHGPNGGPCTYPGQALPFSPSLTGGATNVNAGVFSPFTLTMSLNDGEQNLQSVQAVLPPGLSGVLSNIELCPEPQANLGECGPNSLIGETTVSVGVGGDPYTVSGGKFYLTGPYNGSGACKVSESGCAPFGITFEVPAKAGPFDLERNSANPAGEDACDCVLVRGKIEVNPYTAALTITSNPPGTPDAIPTSIEGIPLEIQHINAITTRSNFQFNPTSCAKMEVTGTIHSSEGGLDKIGVPFQVTNCKSLNFTPKFQVSTNAKTSRANGASLTATVAEPPGALGTQANLARVKVELPEQLPSRLTTLRKACTNAQFEANPAACPPESKIGYAIVHTPLIPTPLEGPAIFVSHGGEAFPSLTMVLQGDNVTIDLVGTTFISKAGVTSTTFKTVPDQPFSSFELTLPSGPYSALTALGNLCKEKLSMPTEFVAQNGAEIDENTKIGVRGCRKTLTRSAKLNAAVRVCRKKHGKVEKAKCEKAARRHYGSVKAKRGRK